MTDVIPVHDLARMRDLQALALLTNWHNPEARGPLLPVDPGEAVELVCSLGELASRLLDLTTQAVGHLAAAHEDRSGPVDRRQGVLDALRVEILSMWEDG